MFACRKSCAILALSNMHTCLRRRMFIDWLSLYQDFDFELPLVSDRHYLAIDTATGEPLGTKQDTLKHVGSFSTSINIRISGNRITVTGNPSRIGRLDNLFGYTTIDACVKAYNEILSQYGLPPFTKCTQIYHLQTKEKEKATRVSDGAIITELHITSNVSVGQGNQDSYIKALSTQPYRQMTPRLHTNGKTCDWLTKTGKASTLMYPSIYNKAHEIKLHTLPKLKKKYGIESNEYKYAQRVKQYCDENGVCRFELKLKSAFMRKHKLQYYGLNTKETMSFLRSKNTEFTKLDERLKVSAMDLQTITQKLIDEGVCTNTKAANATTLYAIQWMHGQRFDTSKSQVKTHRARLRKIGIDIATVCDLQKFSVVVLKASREINVAPLHAPSWYVKPSISQLRAVA